MNSGRGGQREGAGRKQAWKHGETQTIRVPKSLAAQILEIARKLDDGEVIEFDTKSKRRRSSRIESVTKTKKVIDYVTDSSETLKPLSGKALARRLGVSDTAVLKHRKGIDHPGIPEWTKGKDPNGVSWEYREETKLYYPLAL